MIQREVKAECENSCKGCTTLNNPIDFQMVVKENFLKIFLGHKIRDFCGQGLKTLDEVKKNRDT